MKTLTKILILVSAIAAVSCSKENAKSITLNDPAIINNTLNIMVGDIHVVRFDIEPAGAAGHVVWTSDNPSIASVNGGWVMGNDAGTTTVRAASPNGKGFSITVVVSKIDLTAWSAPTAIEVAPGYSCTFEVTGIVPEGASAANLDWEASSDLLTYSINGSEVTVSASNSAKNGTYATLKATNISKTKETLTRVSFVYHELLSLKITPDKLNLNVKTEPSATLELTFNPENATDKRVEWTIEDNSVVSFDESTLTITALKTGSTRITAKGADGREASVTVNVSGLSVQGRGAMFTGETHKFTLDGDESSIEWSSSNPSVATVDGEGTVTALSAGNTVITCRYGQNETATNLFVLTKNYEMIFYRTAFVVGSEFVKGEKPITSMQLVPYRSSGFYVGCNEYVWRQRYFQELFGSAQPFTLDDGGLGINDFEYAVDPTSLYVRVKTDKATYGTTYNIKVTDSNGNSGTLPVKIGCATISFSNRNSFGGSKSETINNGSSTTMSKADISDSDIYVALNGGAEYDANTSACLYDTDVRAHYTLMCDDSSVLSGSNTIRFKDKPLKTYNFYIKEYPQIKWSIRLTN